MKVKFLLPLLAVIGFGCAIDSEVMDDVEYQDSRSTDVTAQELQELVASAPDCDELNEDTIHRDRDTGAMLHCERGEWHLTDLDTYFATQQTSKAIRVYRSFWTSYNGYDRNVYVDCGWSSGRPGVLSGVRSHHHNHYEDRRFSYKCSYIYD